MAYFTWIGLYHCDQMKLCKEGLKNSERNVFDSDGKQALTYFIFRTKTHQVINCNF